MQYFAYIRGANVHMIHIAMHNDAYIHAYCEYTSWVGSDISLARLDPKHSKAVTRHLPGIRGTKEDFAGAKSSLLISVKTKKRELI